MTVEGWYEKGDIVEVYAWWDEDRPTICDVIMDQRYYNLLAHNEGKPGIWGISPFVDVRKRGCAGAHPRCVNLKNIIRRIT